MPISIKCQCGKALKIPDAMAGKAVKCPGCSKVLKVPAPRAAAPRAAAPRAATGKPVQRPAATPPPASQASDGLDDLFDEEGFSDKVESVCPSCSTEMLANEVLCTKCGFHREHGMKLDAHKTEGVDVSHAEVMLKRVESDMAKAKAQQEKLAVGAGMPWWGLALVLFGLISISTILVIAISINRRINEDETASFNAMQWILWLVGGAFLVVGLGAMIRTVIHAFRQDKIKGFLSFTVLYLFYHVYQNAREIWKPFAVALVCIGIAVGCFVGAAGQG